MELNTKPQFVNRVAPVEWEFLASVEKLAEIVRSHGYPCRAYSNKALAKLAETSLEKKQVLALQIKSILEIVSSAQIDKEVPTNEHPERSLIEQALKSCGLNARTEFWDNLAKDDVVEVYSLENVQLFRTFNFFTISSYSILDLLINEWYFLWERPSYVLESLMKLYEELIGGQFTTTRKVEVRPHLLKEIYDDNSQTEFKSSSVMITPQVMSPLYDDNGDLKGFLFTLRGTVMGHDSDADKIAIL